MSLESGPFLTSPGNQMQLAGLGGGAAPGAVAGPELLLYYSYYAQMLSALQTQQKLLQIQQQPSNNNNNNTTAAANTAIKDILSPLKLGNLASLNKDSNQVGNTLDTIILISIIHAYLYSSGLSTHSTHLPQSRITNHVHDA